MSEPLDAFRGGYDRVTIPTIWVAFVLSLLLHAAALVGWLPNLLRLPFEDTRRGKPSGSLSVRLAMPPSIPAHRAPPPSPEVPAPAVRPRAAPRAASAPRVLALARPASSLSVPPPAAAAPAPVPAPAYSDLAAYIAAHRRAREPDAVPSARGSPPQPPAETEQERHNRVVAENLGLTRTPGFGADKQPGGGIFQVERMNYLDAEFVFFGWNKDIRRNSRQVIEVQRGNNPSMELAVVRKMISIIREHVNGDFLWESPRLGRNVTLSARTGDNAELEEFLMREFFSTLR